ncbi:MAG: cupin domain-containing protein [Alphaproteobacteria bacterium]|nr:cupin domain-containing protein [Alphaproteobacteria bacterium]
MTKIISTKNAFHYIWGNNCDGYVLKKDGHFSVISEKMPPNTSEKKHLHKATEQFFYCLEGNLTIECENEEHVLSAHDGYFIASGIPHNVKNNSKMTTRFLVISSSNTQDDRIDLE